MWQWAAPFVAGYACRAHCGSLPFQAHLQTASGGRPFKLSLVIHSAAIEKVGKPGVVQDQRPYVSIRIGDKTKETELGDWSKELGQWCFKEAITLEVVPADEILVDVSSSTKYDFWLASVQLTSSHVGEACFPVSAVMPRLKPEDRDMDGIVWSTPVIPIEARCDGVVTARLFMSFETSHAPPPTQKAAGDGQCGWCGSRAPKRWDGSSAETDEATGTLGQSEQSMPWDASLRSGQ